MSYSPIEAYKAQLLGALEQEEKKINEEKRKLDGEKRNLKEEREKLKVERENLEEERRKFEEEKRKLGEERRKLDEERKKLTEERKELDEKIQLHETITAKLRTIHFPTKIKLDVGGKRFATSLTTLTRYPKSLLGVMFSQFSEIKPEEDGSYFIDRNPQPFHLILDFLRGVQLDLDITPRERRILLQEAEFYQLDGLVDLLNNWHLTPSPNGILSNDNLTFTKTGPTGWNCSVLWSVGWASGVHQWTVVIGKYVDNANVGVASCKSNRTATNFISDGFYMHTSGNLNGQDGTSGKRYGKPWRVEGTKISVRLDMIARTLSFAVDGEWQGVAWTNLPSSVWYPAFELYCTNANFTIVKQQI